MPFEEITERVASGTPATAVSITLKARKGGLPGCIIGIRSTLGKELKGWHTDGARLALLLGKGEDEGKLRLVLRQTGAFGIRRARKGSFGIDLGHVAAFGPEPKAGVGVEATVIEEGKGIEIKLPDWSRVPAPTDEEEPESEPQPAPERQPPKRPEPPRRFAAPTPPAPTPRPPARPSAHSEPPVTREGIAVESAPQPSITFRGQTLQLTYRQARMLQVLVRALGGLMITADLLQRMDVLGADAGALHMDFDKMCAALGSIGLRLTYTNKMGYTLRIE